MTEEKRYQVALSLLPGIGPVLSRQLINHFGTPQQVFKAGKGKINKVKGLGKKLSDLCINHDALLRKADTIIEKSVKLGVSVHYYKEPNYPSRLFSIMDAPIIIYAKGKQELNPPRTVGIVGTRKATGYGISTTERIVLTSVANKPTIISGLAYGIDVKAHESALKNTLPTTGVLACGLDHVYPAVHRNIAEKILENGGLISEYPVGTKADPRFFPARNRIIAALSDALIVVEAAKKGGALITADIAYSYEKPVFAVPGQLDKSNAEGCNLLIRNFKASIYTGFNDIVEALNWDLNHDNQNITYHEKLEKLEGPAQSVVRIMLKNNGQMHVDELSWQSQIPLNQLASILLELEFDGIIKPLPGKEYQLK